MPAAATPNLRNDMYLTNDAITVLGKSKTAGLSPDEIKTLKGFSAGLTKGTRFIPTWVKIAVALALGLGTMIGWKRIVVTVGEKIGKTHLTYGQGAAAEVVAAITILAADNFGLPVSTTHVLSSGVAGTMAANGSGAAMVDHPVHRFGMGSDPAGRHGDRRRALLRASPFGLRQLQKL